MLDHVSIQCSDLEAAASFYDAVLPWLGGGRILDFGTVIGYGVGFQPTFWSGPLASGEPNREVHIAFQAADHAAVDAFFAAAVARGADEIQAPRMCPEYHPNYYGGFVRDPDGNNIEAVCHSPQG
ncbi:MAG: VOC family protein [Ilumatobacteraceae bacterium]